MNQQELNLPIEIIERILWRLDGSSMVRLSRVSTLWRAAYFNVLSRKNGFEAFCRKDISPESLLNVIEKLYPAYNGVGKIDWIRVYKCWHCWENIGYWNPRTTTLIEEHCCRITCVKLSGDWVVYGTIEEGKVEAYNIKMKIKAPIFYRGHGVIDIDLANYKLDSKNHACEQLHHSEIRVLLKNSSISSVPFRCMNYERKFLNCVNSTTEIDTLRWLNMVKNNYNTKLESLGYPIDRNCSLSSCIKTSYYVNVNSEGEVLVVDHDSRVNYQVIYSGFESVTRWRQLSASVSFGIACKKFHMLFFGVGNKIRPYIPPPHTFTVGAAVIHCNMLFLGCSNGILYVYKLQDESNLLSLCLKNYTCKFKVARTCIVDIDIQYTDKNDPYIIVATESTIHKVF